MKLYPACKKQYKLILSGLILTAVICPGFFVFGQTALDVQNKIYQKDSEIAKLEIEITAYQGELENLGQQKGSLGKSLKELDITGKKLTADSNLTQKKIDKTNLKIENLSSDISGKQNSISTNVESIKREIRETDEYERITAVETILSDNNFTDMWNDIDNMTAVREKIRSDIIALKQVKVELEDTRNENISAKNDLLILKTELADRQKIVVQNTNEKNKLLKLTKNSESNYQKLLKDRIAQRDAFEQELRDYEAQLQYILDPSKLPKAGVLNWPLQQIFVTQLFGKTVDAKRLYASGSHSGVDFRASTGTPVMAMADGTVLGIGDTDSTCLGASFGKYVFIQYGNGLSSTFGHLSLIKSQEGDQVKRGEVVGYTGSTGHVTGPHLHVSLYASEAVKMASKPSEACDGRIYRLPVAAINAYLDALYYLPPYTINSSILNNRVTE